MVEYVIVGDEEFAKVVKKLDIVPDDTEAVVSPLEGHICGMVVVCESLDNIPSYYLDLPEEIILIGRHPVYPSQRRAIAYHLKIASTARTYPPL